MAAEVYKKKNNRDPSVFIETDWMSTEVSNTDTDDENNQKEYRKRIGQAAGLSMADIKDGQVAWEVIKPAWRSEMVSMMRWRWW
jgi:hypothetical protein